MTKSEKRRNVLGLVRLRRGDERKLNKYGIDFLMESAESGIPVLRFTQKSTFKKTDFQNRF